MIDATLLASALRLATPLLFAALGGILSERAGVINIALEGKLLAGAFAAAVATLATGDPWTGVAAGAAAGTALGLLHALFGVVLRGDQIVVTRVVVPTRLNDHQRKLFQELAESLAPEQIGGHDEGFFGRIKSALGL